MPRLVPTQLLSLQQSAVWVETRRVPEYPIHRRIAPDAVQELHDALMAGTITASGCVDAGERRAISPGEWKDDYRLKLTHTVFPGHYPMRTAGTPVIVVLSNRSFPAAALKNHGYPSGVRVPSARVQDGEPGYHRVITDVLLPREQIVRLWPSDGCAAPTSKIRSTDLSRTRTKPIRERAQLALLEIFPVEKYPGGVPNQTKVSNQLLCKLVEENLKVSKQPKMSDETILRAAGRLK